MGTADAANPVAQVRNLKSWEYGPFVNWGTGVGDRSDYKFFWGGFELGKVLTPVIHAGIFTGQFEFAGNIMPLWQAYTPAPHSEELTCETPTGQPYTCSLPFGGGTFRGVSLTPVIFRWNFLTNSRRIQPWFQAAGGVIYTTHKFPPNVMSNPALRTLTVATCVWNFSPQGGNRGALFSAAEAVDRSGRERGAHFFGVAGRPQPRSERQHSGAGGIYVLEMKKQGPRDQGTEKTENREQGVGRER